MNLLVKNQCVSISPSKIRGRIPPPHGGRWHEVPEEGECAGALMLPRWSALGGIDAPPGDCVIIHLSQIESRFAREIRQNY